jgi:hypothetical protein
VTSGSMPPMSHLLEFRARLIKAVVAVAVGTAIAFVFNEEILDLLAKPYQLAVPGGQLAFFRPTEAFTPNTISSLDQLLEAEETVRREGFSRDDEEFTVGLRCIAGVIRNHEGEVAAAVSVAIPDVRWSREWENNALRALRNAVTEISGSLGYGRGDPLQYRLG